MRYRSLGDSGLMVSVAGLGCNNFGRRVDLAGTRAVVDAAMDAGITMLDTADTYGDGGASEELLGEVLAGRRDQVVLATKFGHQGYDMGTVRRRAPRAAAPTSGARSRRPCAGSGPTTSICTSCTPPTR
jgi:aryl-alcohol dehydrogenase-like predicted oxidoreductase